MMSALCLQRMNRNGPKQGLDAPQSLSLICPARYLLSALATDLYMRAQVEDRSLTMNRFADRRHCRARNAAETGAREEPYASRYSARLVAENIP